MPSPIPILQQGRFLIASVQSVLDDDDWVRLRGELAHRVVSGRAEGVIVDVTSADVLDSFATRMLRSIAEISRLRGARTVIAGIAPDVAFAMVQLGLTLDGISTVLDLDSALAVLNRRTAGGDAG
ncbi:MAG TPA: STAS domain-containing protein [Candidatus Udaeobacter sp.]|nr:STAS domain-containing protein [Candidatus Udaeobacter sp.]